MTADVNQEPRKPHAVVPELHGVAPSSVEKRVTGNGRASKREVAEAVAAIYPELKAYLPNGSGSGFRSNLFDAVAVGVAEGLP